MLLLLFIAAGDIYPAEAPNDHVGDSGQHFLRAERSICGAEPPGACLSPDGAAAAQSAL